MTVIPEGATTESLNMLKQGSSSFASLDDQVMSIGKIRAGVYRGGLNYDASVVALYNNVTTAYAEWDSAKAGTPAIPVHPHLQPDLCRLPGFSGHGGGCPGRRQLRRHQGLR